MYHHLPSSAAHASYHPSHHLPPHPCMHPHPMYHHLPSSAAHAHACTCPAYHHP
ncbi:hypothetical protein ID866_12892, partial [Astraeus odoratus]